MGGHVGWPARRYYKSWIIHIGGKNHGSFYNLELGKDLGNVLGVKLLDMVRDSMKAGKTKSRRGNYFDF